MIVKAYRGEHGEASTLLQSRLGALSFGSRKAAMEYAFNPNNINDVIMQPRIIEAMVLIDRPFVMIENDCCIEFHHLISALGHEKALAAALKVWPHIENTSLWHDEGYAKEWADARALLAARPQALSDLYCDAYPLLDDVEVVDWLSQAGFDGAAHMGNGVTALEMEYKVFSREQVTILSVTQFDDVAPAAPDRQATRMRACG